MGNRRRRGEPANWALGDVFRIPLADGTSAFGQVHSIERHALNSVLCIFFSSRDIAKLLVELNAGSQAAYDMVISVQFTTRDLLDSGRWEVVSSAPVLNVSRFIDIDAIRAASYVGVDIVGSANLAELMEAYFGLAHWDEWADPEFLDKLLVSPDRKPPNIVLKGRAN